MYLDGLSDAAFAVPGVPRTVQSGSNVLHNMTEKSCYAMGGVWSTYNPNNATMNSYGDCTVPVYSAVPAPTPAPAPQINVNVPTNINTQVSPQVSPNFIQQDHPTGSPVNATTTHQPTQTATTNDADYLKKLADQQQEFMDRMAQLEAQREADASATLPSNPSPAQTVMQPISTAPLDMTGYGVPSDPASSAVAAPGATGYAQYERYLPFALAVAVVVVTFIATKKRGKRNVHAKT